MPLTPPGLNPVSGHRVQTRVHTGANPGANPSLEVGRACRAPSPGPSRSLEDIDIYPFDPFQTSGRSRFDSGVLGVLPWTRFRFASERNGAGWLARAENELSANGIKVCLRERSSLA